MLVPECEGWPVEELEGVLVREFFLSSRRGEEGTHGGADEGGRCGDER